MAGRLVVVRGLGLGPLDPKLEVKRRVGGGEAPTELSAGYAGVNALEPIVADAAQPAVVEDFETAMAFRWSLLKREAAVGGSVRRGNMSERGADKDDDGQRETRRNPRDSGQEA